MRDITKKINTFRTAVAEAIVLAGPASITAVKQNTTSKPDVLAAARAAAFLAVKNTSNVIPLCHPLPVESISVEFDLAPSRITIAVEVKTTYKTGCEMEALHGASIAALTVYDMLKPIDKQIEITGIRLLDKKGGKSDYTDLLSQEIRAAVVVISDSVSAGKKTDKAGMAIREKLKTHGLEAGDYRVVPDEVADIRAHVVALCDQGYDLVITTGGTGLSPRDNTPEALRGVIEREVPGIMEAARAYGQQRTPFSMLSRGMAGLRGRTLVLSLPGSSRGAAESMDALFPFIFHVFKVLEQGYRHQQSGQTAG